MSQFIFLSAHYILHIFLRNKIFVAIRCSSECLLIHFLHVTEIIQHLNTISLTATDSFLLVNMFLILQNAAFVMMDSCSNLYKISSARCYECSKIINQFICFKMFIFTWILYCGISLFLQMTTISVCLQSSSNPSCLLCTITVSTN